MIEVRSNPASGGSPLRPQAAPPPLLVHVEVEELSFASRGSYVLKGKPYFPERWPTEFSLLGTDSCREIPKYLALSAHLVPVSGGAWGACRGVQRNTKHSFQMR